MCVERRGSVKTGFFSVSGAEAPPDGWLSHGLTHPVVS